MAGTSGGSGRFRPRVRKGRPDQEINRVEPCSSCGLPRRSRRPRRRADGPHPAPQAGAAAPTFYAVQPSDMPLSNLYDLNVYNQQNENVGEIEDIIVDGNRTIRAYVLSVGGFLGLNEHYVTVDAGYVTVTRQGDKL